MKSVKSLAFYYILSLQGNQRTIFNFPNSLNAGIKMMALQELQIYERSKILPYAEYEAKTIMCAEALLIEYQKGAVLCDAL